MPASMKVLEEIASRYGFDPHDERAVEEFLDHPPEELTKEQLGAIAEELLHDEELLATSSGDDTHGEDRVYASGTKLPKLSRTPPRRVPQSAIRGAPPIEPGLIELGIVRVEQTDKTDRPYLVYRYEHLVRLSTRLRLLWRVWQMIFASSSAILYIETRDAGNEQGPSMRTPPTESSQTVGLGP